MKVKLLRKLRREAKRKVALYRERDRIILREENSYLGYYTLDALPRALEALQFERRMAILDKVRKLRSNYSKRLHY